MDRLLCFIMEVIIKPSKSTITSLEELGFSYLDFDNRFIKWCKVQKRNSKLNTPEIFSLEYSSLLSELRDALFVFVNRQEDFRLLKSKFKVIEYNE